MTLTRLVLPAPLGPMTAASMPGSTAIDTSRSAATPPKLSETRSTSRRAIRETSRAQRASVYPDEGPKSSWFLVNVNVIVNVNEADRSAVHVHVHVHVHELTKDGEWKGRSRVHN